MFWENLQNLKRLYHYEQLKNLRKKLISFPGDIVIFNDKTAHRSEANLSNKSRRMLFLTFNDVRYGNKLRKYFKDKITNYPPNSLRKRILNIIIKYSYEVSKNNFNYFCIILYFWQHGYTFYIKQ